MRVGLATPVQHADALGHRDDIVAPFQVDGRAVRGRVARLGSAIDDILSAHGYPFPVAALTGEAALLALLIGSAMKFDGRLIIQTRARGSARSPVDFVVADYTAGKGLRAYAKFDADARAALESDKGRQLSATELLGDALFVMTIDQGADMQRHQGVTMLEEGSLARSAEAYFAQSEQLPTRIRLAVGREMSAGGDERWRAGGAMIQRLAEDKARPSDQADYDHARALFDTLSDVELIDRDVSAGRLLYRLYHEDGVRIFDRQDVARYCTCDHARLVRILASFPGDDIAHMTKDGAIVMTCEYCKRDWRFDPAEVEAARARAISVGSDRPQSL